MIRKYILNGLTLSLMLTLIPHTAHAGWFSAISNYFNKPTKNALVATTAIACLATFACAWNWWKNSKKNKQIAAVLTANEQLIFNLRKLNQKLISENKQEKATLASMKSVLEDLDKQPKMEIDLMHKSRAARDTSRRKSIGASFSDAHDLESPQYQAQSAQNKKRSETSPTGFGSQILGQAHS